MNQKRISFAEWIDREGVDRLASRLKINRFTVLHWRAGRHHPRVEQMRILKKLSRGALTFDAIIEHGPAPTNRERT